MLSAKHMDQSNVQKIPFISKLEYLSRILDSRHSSEAQDCMRFVAVLATGYNQQNTDIMSTDVTNTSLAIEYQ